MNGFREEQGLGDAFVVSFAGVLGHSQDLDVVLEAARILNGGRWKMEDGSWKAEGGDWQSAIRNPQSEILFLIVGDGVEKARLEAKAQQMGLDNVRFLPMQPREKYPAVLHASDVCLATLHAEVKTPVVPSKILSIMAAGPARGGGHEPGWGRSAPHRRGPLRALRPTGGPPGPGPSGA